MKTHRLITTNKEAVDHQAANAAKVASAMTMAINKAMRKIKMLKRKVKEKNPKVNNQPSDEGDQNHQDLNTRNLRVRSRWTKECTGWIRMPAG